ncbi:MAG: HAMP domain-containing sensor histidine kinase [Nitrospiraceae bacterium]|nr:HAMP domain-containing sensor histidine kinase [Nitrospiraceae bacterium]
MQVSIAKVIRITHTLSILLSVLAALTVPLVYFSAGYKKEAAVLETETRANASLATRMISNNPLLWRYETERLEEFLSHRPPDRTKEVRRIFDEKGVLIAEYDEKLDPPLLKRDFSLFDSGHVVGRLEISRSLRHLFDSTAKLTFAAGLLGFFVYLFMRIVPLHALDEALGTLTELNRTLEQRVNEEVAKGREKDLLLMQQSKFAAMGEMIGNIAHQWRQPLNAVGLIIQDLKSTCLLGSLDKEYLNTSVEKAMTIIRHMSMTIDDFRYFYQPGKERFTFNVGDAVAKALFVINASFSSGGIGIEVDVEDDMSVDGFPNEYAQVLLNLLSNARDVLVERDIQNPRVMIRGFKEGNKAVVTVRDNGGGIDGDIIDKIFEPYYSTKKEGKGTGIGLSMSKMIIEKNMGGELTAANTEDGAEFRIEV